MQFSAIEAIVMKVFQSLGVLFVAILASGESAGEGKLSLRVTPAEPEKNSPFTLTCSLVEKGLELSDVESMEWRSPEGKVIFRVSPNAINPVEKSNEVAKVLQFPKFVIAEMRHAESKFSGTHTCNVIRKDHSATITGRRLVQVDGVEEFVEVLEDDPEGGCDSLCLGLSISGGTLLLIIIIVVLVCCCCPCCACCVCKSICSCCCDILCCRCCRGD